MGGGGGANAAIANINDYTGFTSIFDGTLKDWDGPTNFFDIQDGAIHARAGESPPPPSSGREARSRISS